MNANLTQKKCVPCEIGTPPLKQEQFAPLLRQLKLEWQVTGNKKIQHEFKFKDFRQALDFVNKVAKIAEEEGHHPNIHIYYKKVLIELTTHFIKGLSENDFIIAAKIEDLKQQLQSS